MSRKKIEHEVGSGNVFADIGLPNAEEHLIKAQLVYKISRIMKHRRLTQVEAARIFGVKQPDVSKCCAAIFASFPPSGCSIFSWHLATMSRSS